MSDQEEALDKTIPLAFEDEAVQNSYQSLSNELADKIQISLGDFTPDKTREISEDCEQDELEKDEKEYEKLEKATRRKDKISKVTLGIKIRSLQIGAIYFVAGAVSIWMLVVLFIIAISGVKFDYITVCGIKFYPFVLDTSVAIAFITTTTANVLGGLWLVLHWLYKDRA